MSSWNTVIKGTDTPVIIRVNGVDLPDQANIIITLGSETYNKNDNPNVIKTFDNDITRLNLLLGDTNLAEASYKLHLTIVNSDAPRGIVLTDCVEGDVMINVRDIC